MGTLSPLLPRRAQTTTTGPGAMGSTSSKSLLAAAMGVAVFMTHAEAFVSSPGLTINSAAARLHVTGRAAPRPALLSLRGDAGARVRGSVAVCARDVSVGSPQCAP